MADEQEQEPQPTLTRKQLAFVEHYVACLNGAEAARRAGYPKRSARQIATENLSKPDIRAAVDRALDDQAMGPSEILARLSAHARSTADDFLTIERVTRRDTQLVPDPEKPGTFKMEPGPEYEVAEIKLDIEKAKGLDKLHLIKKMTEGRYGLQIELYDAQAALQLLGKGHGIFVERHELDLNWVDDAAASLDRKLGAAPDDEPEAPMGSEP